MAWNEAQKYKTRKGIFLYVEKLRAVLQKDVTTALSNLDKVAERYGADHSNLTEVQFWFKATIRSFFALIEGTNFATRKCVVLFGPPLGIDLTTRERAKLAERRYDKANDQLLRKYRRIPPELGVKLSFRYYPQLFGASFSLDTGGQDWVGLKTLVKARNKITHPRTFHDLLPYEALWALRPTLIWYLDESFDLFLTCARALGGDLPDPEEREWKRFREKELPAIPEFDKETEAQISSVAASSINYTTSLLKLLGEEVDQATSLVQATNPISEFGQFAIRNYMGALFAVAEGRQSAARFFIEAAISRGEISDAVDLSGCDSGELPEGLTATFHLFSELFGTGYRLPQRGKEWEGFLKAHAVRNRITHPQRAEDLKITLPEFQQALNGSAWLIHTLKCLIVDEGKLQSLARPGSSED